MIRGSIMRSESQWFSSFGVLSKSTVFASISAFSIYYDYCQNAFSYTQISLFIRIIYSKYRFHSLRGRKSTFLVCTSQYEKVRFCPSSDLTVNTAGNTAVTSPLRRVDFPLPVLIFISTGMPTSFCTLSFAPVIDCPISLIQ